jgi:hypothetical protein
MGAREETPYPLAGRGTARGSPPHGGRFDGGDAFGENGVRMTDVEGEQLTALRPALEHALESVELQ